MRILYIDIDSLRPDHLGCYGYHRNTSPSIDQIARDGVIFRKTYTVDSPCLPSRSALYSGRFGIQTGVVGHGGISSQPKIQDMNTRRFRDTFVEQGFIRELTRKGWHTAMISPFGQRHAAHWFYAGFLEIHNTGHEGMESAEQIQPYVDKWMHENAKHDNWYLHVNYWDPHTPYRVPLEYGDPFANDPLPAWLTDEKLIERHSKKVGPHTAQDIGGMYDDREDPRYPRHLGKISNLNDVRRLIDGYDTGIRYADDHIAKIIATLKAAGVYEETAIIISGDHGESFGELGIYGEHATADESVNHIPMIIKWPGGRKGAEENGLHYNIDLVPTLMDLTETRKHEIWDGKSFAESITKESETGRNELILSHCAMTCQRSVRWSQWLYIRTYHDGFHLYPQEMLFDIERDPYEQNDLTAQHPELCKEGAWRLLRWHDEQMQKMAKYSTDSVDPLWSVMREGGPFHANLQEQTRDPGGIDGFLKYLKRLDETGRKEGSDALRKKYAAFLPSEKINPRRSDS